MKTFRFSLQSLRLLREQKERVAQKRYVEASRTSDEAAAQLDLNTQELAASWMILCEEVAEGVTFAKLRQTRAWCGVLERRAGELAAALRKAQEATHQAWREMALASRDREALDRLHDKSRRAYNREAQRDEQKQLDEMGLRVTLASSALAEFATTSRG
jgi:flagellar export protein FliJ